MGANHASEIAASLEIFGRAAESSTFAAFRKDEFTLDMERRLPTGLLIPPQRTCIRRTPRAQPVPFGSRATSRS